MDKDIKFVAFGGDGGTGASDFRVVGAMEQIQDGLRVL